MAVRVLADAGFLVALLSRRDAHHRWAAAQARQFIPPWRTCEAVLSETIHLVGAPGLPALSALIRRDAVVNDFDLASEIEPVLRLMQARAPRES